MLTPRQGYAFTRACLSICLSVSWQTSVGLSVSNITKNNINGFWWNFQDYSAMIQGTIAYSERWSWSILNKETYACSLKYITMHSWLIRHPTGALTCLGGSLPSEWISSTNWNFDWADPAWNNLHPHFQGYSEVYHENCAGTILYGAYCCTKSQKKMA